MPNGINLLVKEDVMKDAISDFEQRKAGLQIAYLSIFRQVHTLEDQVWSGAASELFRDRFDELFKNIEDIEDVMERIVNKLKEILNIIESAENIVTPRFDDAVEGTQWL